MKNVVHRLGRYLVPAVLLVAILGAYQPAEAQLSLLGGASILHRATVAAPAIKGTDSGYDPAHGVYLVVGSCYGGSCPAVYGAVYGVFVNRAGTPVTGIFSINPGGSEGHFPRIRFSAQVNGGQGGFLVTWLEEGASGGLNLVKARLVAYPGVLLGAAPATLNDNGTSYAWIESAAAVGYSPVSQRFLVAWRTYPHVFSSPHVAARLVDIAGSPVEAVVKLSAGFGRDPGVTWNSTNNTFGVSFSAENSAGSAGFSGFAVVPPVNAAAFARNSFNQIAGFTYISDVAYNPVTQRFVMIWHQTLPQALQVAEIDGSGQPVSMGLISPDLPGYDAHSIGYNPISGTFGLSSIDANDDIVLAELNRNGVRTSAITVVGPNVTGRYPRISAHTQLPDWNISFSNGFQTLDNLSVNTTSTGGGPSGSNPPPGTPAPAPSPSPTPTPTGCTTVQPGPGWTCVNGNWLPPSDPVPAPAPSPTPSPTPTTCTTPQPGPDWTCVNGNWLPPGSGTPAPAPSSCTTVQPAPGWTCVNGNWIPPTTPSCSTVQPGPGWTCVNGNWLPPGAGPAPSTCFTPQPGPDWTCYNGDWLPPGMAPTAPAPAPAPAPSTGCSTVQPGPDWICVNGDWRPVDQVCPTVKPGPNWVCVNGDWRPIGLDDEPEMSAGLAVGLPSVRPEAPAAILRDRSPFAFPRRA